VRLQRAERPVKHQPGDLSAEAVAAQLSGEQADAVGRAVLIGVHGEPRAADAAAGMLDRPRVLARQRHRMPDGHLLSGAEAPPVPLPPPRRAVTVLFFRVDRVPEPVIDIAVARRAQGDPVADKNGQWRQSQPVTHPSSQDTKVTGPPATLSVTVDSPAAR